MSKVKLCVVLALALVCALAYAAPALAWTHGQFSATTDACAGCHVAHAATAPKLLKAGTIQTQFCYLCHGDGCVSAPYDIKDGKTWVAGAVYEASTAGGFETQYGSGSIMSRHTVEGYDHDTSTAAGGWNVSAGSPDIPGSSSTIPGSFNFRCGSCHDPHDGGAVPDSATWLVYGSSSTPNPRLLRKSISVSNATYSGLYVCFKFKDGASVGSFTYGNPAVVSGVYVVDSYVYGTTDWCGACHNIFNVGTDSGHTLNYGMYRHAFNITLESPYVTDAADPLNVTFSGTPLEIGSDITGTTLDKKRVVCLSCHRAHGSTATAQGWASSWPTDPNYGSTSGQTSALLRMDNRGVCYNCHKAAEQNKPT